MKSPFMYQASIKTFAYAIVISFTLLACNDVVNSEGSEADNSLTRHGNSDIAFNVQYIRGDYKDSGTPWPLPAIVTVVSSKNEFDQYYGKGKIKKYSDNYFADNFLVIVELVEGSGSVRHEVERIDENGNIVINQFIPEILTTDIGKWYIIIELDNKFKGKKFQAAFVEVLVGSYSSSSSVEDNSSSSAAQPSDIAFIAQYIRGDYKDSSTPWPLPAIVTVVSSKNEFDQYYGKGKIKKYSDNYFADNFLVIVELVEGSGSIRHEVERIDENGNIVINRFIPEIVTDDIGKWYIIIELDNKFKDKKFRAEFVEVLINGLAD